MVSMWFSALQESPKNFSNFLKMWPSLPRLPLLLRTKCGLKKINVVNISYLMTLRLNLGAWGIMSGEYMDWTRTASGIKQACDVILPVLPSKHTQTCVDLHSSDTKMSWLWAFSSLPSDLLGCTSSEDSLCRSPLPSPLWYFSVL